MLRCRTLYCSSEARALPPPSVLSYQSQISGERWVKDLPPTPQPRRRLAKKQESVRSRHSPAECQQATVSRGSVRTHARKHARIMKT
jgi:hypothetical protein